VSGPPLVRKRLVKDYQPDMADSLMMWRLEAGVGKGSVNVLVNKCIDILVDQDIIDPNLLSWPGDYKEGKVSTQPPGHLTYVHIDSIIKVVSYKLELRYIQCNKRQARAQNFFLRLQLIWYQKLPFKCE